jgi:23S rRNA (uracil1939-C5)-methyltransferase
MQEKVFEQIEILDAGSEGKAIAKIGELVIFVPFVVPGDTISQEEKDLSGRESYSVS